MGALANAESETRISSANGNHNAESAIRGPGPGLGLGGRAGRSGSHLRINTRYASDIYVISYYIQLICVLCPADTAVFQRFASPCWRACWQVTPLPLCPH